MKTFLIALKALVFMSGFVLLWLWIAMSVRVYDRSAEVVLPSWASLPGIACVVMGGMLVLWCGAVFVVRGRGTPALFDAPREFVATGAYRYARNPMYAGGMTMLIGLGLYQQSISILLLSLPWFLLFRQVVISIEEPALRRKFGAAYEEYCRRVPRWIPEARAGDRRMRPR